MEKANACFEGLVANAMEEIRRREPSYLKCSPFALAPIEAHVANYLTHPLFQRYSADELIGAASQGLSYIADHGTLVSERADADDPIGLLMLDSIMDAFAAAQGHLPLSPFAGTGGRAITEILAASYDKRKTDGGTTYLIRRDGDRPLVLINACGVPLGIWSRFLGDLSHSFRTIVVESPTAEMLAGGMRRFADLTADADAIAEVLEAESIGRADIVGWCSGGRPAIELSRRAPGKVRSLVLLSITLRGIHGVAPQPNPFEDDMDVIFKNVSERPPIARIFAKTFEQQLSTDALEKARDGRRPAAFLAQPAQEHASALVTPMLEAESLTNYGRRMLADAAHPIGDALATIDAPIMLVTGENDSVVNNEHTCSGLKTWRPGASHAAIKGGGHYLQDLQYPYFRLALTEFLAGRVPPSSARIQINCLEG